jgi:hypothetical protein
VGDDGAGFLRHPEPDVHIAGDPLGRTYTPDAVALACCRALAAMGCDPSVVREPCVGGGAFVRAVAEVWSQQVVVGGWIDAADIDPNAPGLGMASRYGEASMVDATDPVPAPGLTPRYDLIITNPPFGEEAGDVDVRIYAAQRPACDWLALLMPIEHACLKRWAEPMQSAVIVPLTGRVWSVVRGMALYVWGPGLRPLHPPITHGGRA